MERTSAIFAKVAKGKSAGDDLLAHCKRVKNHHGFVGVARATLLRWRAAGWVDVVLVAKGKHRMITAVVLLSKGVEAATEKQAKKAAGRGVCR